ncbi:MAG: heavy metal transporter, partial [Acutalibacteraceae bacterium]
LSGFFTPQLLFCISLLLAVIGIISLIPFKKALIKRIALVSACVCSVIVIAFCCVQNPAVLSRNSASQDCAEIVNGVQVVHSVLKSGEYPDIQVQCGMPVKWLIEASEDSINGCNYQMLIDEYGLKYTFHAGENIIEFTPEKTGNFSYICWMGMIYGKITVTE